MNIIAGPRSDRIREEKRKCTTSYRRYAPFPQGEGERHKPGKQMPAVVEIGPRPEVLIATLLGGSDVKEATESWKERGPAVGKYGEGGRGMTSAALGSTPVEFTPHPGQGRACRTLPHKVALVGVWTCRGARDILLHHVLTRTRAAWPVLRGLLSSSLVAGRSGAAG